MYYTLHYRDRWCTSIFRPKRFSGIFNTFLNMVALSLILCLRCTANWAHYPFVSLPSITAIYMVEAIYILHYLLCKKKQLIITNEFGEVCRDQYFVKKIFLMELYLKLKLENKKFGRKCQKYAKRSE